MNLFILIVAIAILIETTYLALKTSNKPIIKNNQKRKVYIDTSALIDGRVLSIAKAGFLGDDLIIPRSVVRELQLLADGKDNEKRSRARFGLDNVNELERVVLAHVTIYQDKLDRTPVDERLIELAKANGGLILTTDFNLNKVAATEGIDVLNVNDLAMMLRTEYLPGDRFKLHITSAGSNPNQGVGHLPDGTMVVVDNASSRVNQDVEIEFVRFHQTSAGRMMFAKPVNTKKSKQKSQQKQSSPKKDKKN